MTKDITDMTLAERREYQLGLDAMRQIEYDIHSVLGRTKAIPQDWHQIDTLEDHRHPTTTRITIRLDSDVVKFFRSMGTGYQPRINRVLRAFMHMRKAKIVEGPDTTDYITAPNRIQSTLPQRRTEWGDHNRMEELLEELREIAGRV